MLQKVKKLGSKLFGDSPDKRDDPMGEDMRSNSTSSKVTPFGSGKLGLHASGRKPAGLDMDLDMHSPTAAGGNSFSKLGVGHESVGLPSSPSSKGCSLPPVQASGNSGTSQHSNLNSSGAQSPKQVIGTMMAANQAGSGRRKSTPAALDMALRTAEGKQAIEDLINSAGKKPMVFGQYFTNASKTGAEPSRGNSTSRFSKSPGALSPAGAMPGQPMQSVAEDEDMPMAHPSAVNTEQPMPPSVFMAPVQQHMIASHATQAAPMLHAHYMQQRPNNPLIAVPQAGLSTSAAHLAAALAAQQAHGGVQPMALDQPLGSGTLTIPAAAAAANYRPITTPQKRPAESPSPSQVASKQAVLQHMHVHAPSFQASSSTSQAAPHEVHAQAHVAAAHILQPAPPQVPQAPRKETKILAMAAQLPAGMARQYWTLSDYSVIRKMYTGYASTVYQATCKKSLEQVALKVYHMENLCELNHYQVYREIRVHSSLAHQHIINLFCAFQEGNDVVMVQEYAEGGDLYRLLHRAGGRLNERQAVEMVLHPFLLALHYLHTRGIMHRDIKPENVLFTEHRVLKLADFGLAIDLTEERAVTRAGTLDYMAPEVLRCPPKNLPQENKNNASLHYNNSVDAWAVGVFAFELVVGLPPFAGKTQLDSVDKIIHATPEFPEKMSELAKSFITAALKKHPGDRPSVMEMLHHPWIRSYQRRTSMRVPQAMMRRRSSVQYPQGMGGLAPAPENGPMPQHPGAAPNMDNMTPEEIEHMIQRLQMQRNPLAEHGL